jgi:integrase
MTTGKGRGRRKAVIPLTSSLRQLLATIPKRATTVLTNTYGKPWASGFSSSWKLAMTKSGLPRTEDGKGWILHFHDFRGTAATNLFRAGFSAREIAQIVGGGEERVERLLDRYVRRDEIMRDRIRRLDEFEAGIKSAKLSAKRDG